MRKHGAFQIEEETYNKHEQDGWPTPSGKQEIYSKSMVEFGYPEHSIPHYRVMSHVHPDNLQEEDEYCLLPNFRLPSTSIRDRPTPSGSQRSPTGTPCGSIPAMRPNSGSGRATS